MQSSASCQNASLPHRTASWRAGVRRSDSPRSAHEIAEAGLRKADIRADEVDDRLVEHAAVVKPDRREDQPLSEYLDIVDGRRARHLPADVDVVGDGRGEGDELSS